MRVLLLANERSGVGRSPRLVRELAAAMRHEGVRFEHVTADRRGVIGLGDRLRDCDAMVAVGGDGTVHHSLRALMSSGAPFYHVPAGNENLLSREFGSSGSASALLASLRVGRTISLDVGLAGDSPFAIMLSIGPDAGVVHRLAAARGGATGHAMYVQPTVAEVLRPHLGPLTVRVDGRVLVQGVPGQLVVANCRQYAMRINPAPNACMRDGMLDVAFMPASSVAGLLVWGLRCAVGSQQGTHGWVGARGERVEIESEAPLPWQFDGERGGWVRPGEPLVVSIARGAVRTLASA